MADADLVVRLLENARRLAAERQAIYAEQAVNRRLLRDLAAQGVLNAAQAREVSELYPPRAPRGSRSVEQED